MKITVFFYFSVWTWLRLWRICMNRSESIWNSVKVLRLQLKIRENFTTAIENPKIYDQKRGNYDSQAWWVFYLHRFFRNVFNIRPLHSAPTGVKSGQLFFRCSNWAPSFDNAIRSHWDWWLKFLEKNFFLKTGRKFIFSQGGPYVNSPKTQYFWKGHARSRAWKIKLRWNSAETCMVWRQRARFLRFWLFYGKKGLFGHFLVRNRDFRDPKNVNWSKNFFFLLNFDIKNNNRGVKWLNEAKYPSRTLKNSIAWVFGFKVVMARFYPCGRTVSSLDKSVVEVVTAR